MWHNHISTVGAVRPRAQPSFVLLTFFHHYIFRMFIRSVFCSSCTNTGPPCDTLLPWTRPHHLPLSCSCPALASLTCVLNRTAQPCSQAPESHHTWATPAQAPPAYDWSLLQYTPVVYRVKSGGDLLTTKACLCQENTTHTIGIGLRSD